MERTLLGRGEEDRGQGEGMDMIYDAVVLRLGLVFCFFLFPVKVLRSCYLMQWWIFATGNGDEGGGGGGDEGRRGGGRQQRRQTSFEAGY